MVITDSGDTRIGEPCRPQGPRETPKEEDKCALPEKIKPPGVPDNLEMALIRQLIRMSV
jgi:hypothetical protein